MPDLPPWLRPRRLKKQLQDLGMATGLIPAHRNYNKFIILGRGRSGSNFLATSLSSHPGAVSFGELFNNHAQEDGSVNFQSPGYNSRDPDFVSQRDNRPLEFLDQNVFGDYPRSVRAVGFKLFYYHAQNTEWLPVWDYLRQLNVRALHIQRNNYLEALVSERIAEITQTWSIKQRNNKKNDFADKAPTQLTLSVAECQRHFEAIAEQRNSYSDYFESTLDVVYEDLLNNYNAELKKVQDFLGLPAREVTSPLRKQAKRAIHDTIANFDELATAFSGGPWERFFTTTPTEPHSNNSTNPGA